MSMEVNRQELKARARERLRASHPAFWKITLVYLLLTSGVTAVADLAGAARIGLPPLHWIPSPSFFPCWSSCTPQ